MDRKFFNEAIDRNIILLKSEVVDDELSGAPDFVQEFVEKFPSENIQTIPLSEEAILLSEKYILEKVVGESSRADCLHIAVATIEKADLLVSWNYKHIVNIEKIDGFNSVNIKNGFQALEIRNPREAFDYDD